MIPPKTPVPVTAHCPDPSDKRGNSFPNIGKSYRAHRYQLPRYIGKSYRAHLRSASTNSSTKHLRTVLRTDKPLEARSKAAATRTQEGTNEKPVYSLRSDHNRRLLPRTSTPELRRPRVQTEPEASGHPGRSSLPGLRITQEPRDTPRHPITGRRNPRAPQPRHPLPEAPQGSRTTSTRRQATRQARELGQPVLDRGGQEVQTVTKPHRDPPLPRIVNGSGGLRL